MQYKKDQTVWFITGSQHLYGVEAIEQVAQHSKEMVTYLNKQLEVPVEIVFQPVQTTSESIYQVFRDANADERCMGVICWMHTFSPAQMWIPGLKALQKPLLHMHTQYNRDIPFNEIDMDFMNLNQAAHGDREFGFICSRVKAERSILVGHWKDENTHAEMEDWVRAAMGWNESQNLKIARLGDNMRQVAVTEGNKVSGADIFGWSVPGFGVGELVNSVNNVSDEAIQKLVQEYADTYYLDHNFLNDPGNKEKIQDAAAIELGLLQFLEQGGFGAFTTTFEDLHGLKQLPGLAVPRLMEKGYGFGAEGDWKTSALVRIMKVMSSGMHGGTSFMEDYTYHLEPGNMMVLGAHMLEICPSIASGKSSLQVHPLSIGDKDDPARLVFSAKRGQALNASLIDRGDRFRLLVNTVEAIEPRPLPKLPVARALWKPYPDLKNAAKAWILAGGAHHTGFSFDVKPIHLQYFAQMAGIEYLLIDQNLQMDQLQNEIRWNELYYKFAKI